MTSKNKDQHDYFADHQYVVEASDFIDEIDDTEVINVNDNVGFSHPGPSSPEDRDIDAYYGPAAALCDPQIPQYDGNDSIDDDTDNLVVGVGNNTTNIRTRTAQFELNQRKQTAGIYRDAQIQDFKMIHKDHGKNVNIECNSGFYAQVAKPTVSSLAHDPILPVLGYSIVCDNITKNTDALGLEYNLTVFFRVVQNNGNSTKVTIHTHNSKRCVQVQGGSTMPDRSTSALWFVKNVLYERFKDLAKARSFSIAGFNQAITSAGYNPGKHSKKCGFCDRNLDARSFPLNCSSCDKWFHKTNCHKAHRCMSTSNTGLPSSLSTPASSSVISLSSSTAEATPTSTSYHHPPTKSTTAASTISSTISTSPQSYPAVLRTSFAPMMAPLSSTSNSSTTRALVMTVPSSLPSASVSTSDISPPSSLNADAPLFNPPPPQMRKAKQTQHLSTFTPEKAEMESLKIELSFARTKITDLETKNKDQEQTINIYSQKIKLLHDSQVESLQQKYFPTKDPDSSSPSSASLSLDCDCKIRAQIVRNAHNIKDISKRLCQDQEHLSGLQHSSTLLASSSDTGTTATPSTSSSSSPTTNQVPVSSSLPGSSSSTMQPKDVERNKAQPKSVLPAQDDEAFPQSDHESDFDFSESFEAPPDSPRVCLN